MTHCLLTYICKSSVFCYICQVLWLSRELVKNSVTGADTVINSLMRQVAGGDIAPKNIWLTESLLDILSENRPWLDKYPALVSMAVYTYLRVIVDHNAQMFHTMRQREAEFTATLLREKVRIFDCCGTQVCRNGFELGMYTVC